MAHIFFRLFDLANHWCEWAGLDQDWSLLPNKIQQKEFVKSYFDFFDEEKDEKEIEYFRNRVDECRSSLVRFVFFFQTFSFLFWLFSRFFIPYFCSPIFFLSCLYLLTFLLPFPFPFLSVFFFLCSYFFLDQIVSHFFWGLWGTLMNLEKPHEPFYKKYSDGRLKKYFELKKSTLDEKVDL